MKKIIPFLGESSRNANSFRVPRDRGPQQMHLLGWGERGLAPSHDPLAEGQE